MCLFLAGLPAAWAEISAVVRPGHSFQTRATSLANGTTRVAASTDSQRRVLEICLDVLSDLRSWLPDAPNRAAILSHCKNETDRALRFTPVDSYLWTVLAWLELDLGETQRARDALETARALAPDEMWLAARRLPLSERLAARGIPDQRAAQDADLLVLAQSRSGIATLARRYLDEPIFRDRITKLVATLTDEEQRRFVRNVRVETQIRQDPIP